MNLSSLRVPETALLFAALVTAFPAGAQMYKWVDERGVVSYSNSPPPNAGKAAKVDVVEDRVSVYTPDRLINQAMAEEAANARDAKTTKKKPESEPKKPSKTADPDDAAQKQARLKSEYDRCVSERRVECDTILSGNPSPASSGFSGLPQYVIGTRLAAVPPAPFYVDKTPPPRIGVSTAPKVGIDDRPPVGAPQRQRPIGSSR